MGKTAWAVTGAGHLLKESLEVLEKIKNYELFCSPASLEVASIYKLNFPQKPITDTSASTLECRGFFSGKYERLVIAPATSNSVAKFVAGISDSMASTLFAQAGKAGIPITVLPSDSKEIIETMGATKPITIKARPIDLENVEKLKKFPKVTVVADVDELKKTL